MILKRPNGKWRVQVKHRGSVVADRTFGRRGDAARWEMEQKRLLLSGEFVSPAAGRITVAELAEEYRDSRNGQVSVRAWESDESALRVHIVPAFAKLPISSITVVHIERFLTDLAVSRSVRTAARVRTTLRGLFRYAVRTRRIAKSPAEDVPLPRPDSRTGKVVEVAPFTIALLLQVVDSQRVHTKRYADITLVLALTGLRFGELRGLRVRDLVVVPYPGLVVKRSIPQSGRTGAVIERATTKSGRSRLVPLTDLVRPVVESWAEGREPDDLLFPAPEGGYLSAQNWRRAVRWTTTGLGRRPHDLRHTAASLWIAAGVDIKTVSSWLGHSTAKLTLDTYGHLMGTDADRAALDRVNKALGNPTGTQRGSVPIRSVEEEAENGS
ncbi:hypothetical protein N864_00680 [Intrasporangium chromatireducens Q5-1]|uniref:Integrase n=1 Tax=Intrasporangium chromatireducens Q5-1 TaxID=584657 RepID=W9GIK6_9MICO|nr:site-specific integrase [Intrasporangium chromatireducens]EWT06051.1 hypothetical protein N864_00680 [Intrasporangium chromatireducens Q5-1]